MTKYPEFPISDFFPILKGTLSPKEKNRILWKLLDRAWEIRTLEIELYWKRAAYFWVFIGVAFVAYYQIDRESNIDFKLVVSCIGFIFSYGWYCVNRGSKYWMENWEAKVNRIEKELGVTLNRIQFQKGKDNENYNSLVGRMQFSVTKINTLISLFITLVWLLLVLYHIFEILNCNEKVDIASIMVCILTLFVFIGITCLVNSIQNEPEMKYLL